MTISDFEVLICFETHVELKTRSKLFCRCPVAYGAEPNSHICPVCTGQPGALPVLNREAVEHAVRTGLALNCAVNRFSRFARKNYFYPDLPKGYQISQYELPFCENGWLEIPAGDGPPYAVGIRRVHLEEDAGKLVHSAASLEASEYSLVDYNRASVPLLEIVGDHTRNPLRTLPEARNYLDKLIQLLRYIRVSDCIIEKGQLRCDVNISLRPRGSREFGNRAEIKNMSSFKAIMDALRFEIQRQSEALRAGKAIDQETRLFDEAKRVTIPMRSKEDAPDYRYFPDPDLVPVELSAGRVEELRQGLPELPDDKVERLVRTHGIGRNEALILARDRAVSDFFETCAAHCEDLERLTRWIIKDLFRLLNQSGVAIQDSPLTPAAFADLLNLLSRGELTEQNGRAVLEEMFRTGEAPESIVKARGLGTIRDPALLARLIQEVLAEHPEVASQIRSGNLKPLSYLIGQVMNRTRGRAEPALVKELLRQRLGLATFAGSR